VILDDAPSSSSTIRPEVTRTDPGSNGAPEKAPITDQSPDDSGKILPSLEGPASPSAKVRKLTGV
jgi:hypothetical protein